MIGYLHTEAYASIAELFALFGWGMLCGRLITWIDR